MKVVMKTGSFIWRQS